MSTPKIPADGKLRTLARPVLVRRLRLVPDQEKLLDWQATPAALLDQLCGKGFLTEAARLLAYALPDREAVWWGCMCVHHMAREPEAKERQALEAAEAWVWQPNEATGRHAAWAAVAAGYDRPGAWAALAAYWAQRPGRHPGRVGRGVETAIMLAVGPDPALAGNGPARNGATDSDPVESNPTPGGSTEAMIRHFIASGRDIAAGGAGRLPAMSSEQDVPA